ncbi:MAG TPA: DUF6279 family lipoprotein [Ramlibacter sp.]|nr:DUF6279 family lipoprotein [Ramlibacter sp.]
MTILPRTLRIIGALLAAAALVSCSAIKLGYSAVDDMAYLWLDGYLGFSDEQGARVRDDLQRLHTWHRTQELPRVADLLGRMEQLAPHTLTPVQVCAFVPELQARLMAIADQAEPAVVRTALSLTPRQLRHLQRKSGENNRKWREEWIDIPPGALKEKRFKQVVDRLEMIYGTLDEAQRAVLRAGLERSVFDPQRTLVERQRRQSDLQQILQRLAGSQTPLPEARAALRGYLERSLRAPDPGYRAYQQAQQEESCQLIAAVHAAASPAQREQAARRLRAYQRDLRELSGAAAS